MLNVDLNGKWVGFYELGPDYGDKISGEKTAFSVNLKDNNGEFEGGSSEGNDKSFNKAFIKGFFDGNMISFIKQYPALILIDNNGKRAVDENSTHPEIEYTGYYDEQLKSFSGDWEMITSSSVKNREGENMIAEEYYLSGKWTMSRSENL